MNKKTSKRGKREVWHTNLWLGLGKGWCNGTDLVYWNSSRGGGGGMDTIEPTSILEIITIPFHIIRPIDSNGCQNWLPHENRNVVFTNKILNTAAMRERNYQ